MAKKGIITLVGPLTAYPHVKLLHDLGITREPVASHRIRCWQVVEVKDSALLHNHDLVGEPLYGELMTHGPETVICKPPRKDERERYITTREAWDTLKAGRNRVRGSNF